MARRKHIVLVHGRSTKPAEKDKRQLVLRALTHGLERASQSAANALRTGEVAFTLAYYGDINNAILSRHDKGSAKWLTAHDPDHENALCEERGTYEASLEKCLARPSDQFTKEAYKRFLREVPDRRYLDDVASFASGLADLIGLSKQLVSSSSPDMAAYLTTRRYGTRIRERLQAPLQEALLAGDEVCLVSHSMGCLVAYDVTWKFSRMSEYRHLHSRPVDTFLTLGCPLGEPGIRENLYDSNEGADGLFPDNAFHTWINIPAHDDFVCHDETISDDFSAMQERNLVAGLVDRPKIYNFWEGFSGANPHKLYGYLSHPVVGAELARWIEQGRVEG